MRRIAFLLLLALLVDTLGCEHSDSTRHVTLTRMNNGETVIVSKGDEISVVLPGNPTTGYRWEVAEIDESRVALVNSSYTADSDLVGAGGEFRFDFKTVGTGEMRLRVVYKRPWEPDVPETFTVTIKIR